ncbi:MAG: hypothetical protein V4657_11405 [Pseudomonadota bacterium]
MNIIARLFKRAPSPAERLAATLRPRPDLRDRRFATWSMDRRERYLAASYGVPHSIRDRARETPAANFPVPVTPSGTGLCDA